MNMDWTTIVILLVLVVFVFGSNKLRKIVKMINDYEKNDRDEDEKPDS